MEKIIVIVDWRISFEASSTNNQLTAGILATAPTLEEVKEKYKDLVELHLKKMKEYGFDIPEDYFLQFKLLDSAKKESFMDIIHILIFSFY